MGAGGGKPDPCNRRKRPVLLKSRQKAVFYSESAKNLAFEEEENPFWKAEAEKTESEASAGQEAVTRWLFTNEYRPVLYAQKKLEAVPDDVDAGDAAFTFQILTRNEDGEMQPLADAEFWYVDSARTDGGIPSKVTDLGENGVGYTDQDGKFTIQEGQIIALFPGKAGTVYELRETGGAEGDWLCREDTVTGTLRYRGLRPRLPTFISGKTF